MASTTTLLTLPAEMLTAVAEQVDPHDLLALRLVCRQVSKAAWSAFCETYVARIKVLFTYDSLLSLVDVTLDKDFAKQVLVIQFVISGPRGHAPPHHGDRCDTSGSLPGRCSVCQEWANATATRQRLGGTPALLVGQVLNNLKAASGAPALHISANGDVKDTHGNGAVRRQWAGYPTFGTPRKFTEGDPDEAVTALLSALVCTQFPVRTLDLCSGLGVDRSISRHSVHVHPGLLQHHGSPFANLTTLRLGYGECGNNAENENELWEEKDHQDFIAAFRSTTAVQQLTVHCNALEGSANLLSLDVIGRALESNELKHIELVGIKASVQDYIAFLRLFAKTLKRLELKFDFVDWDECWSTVFQWLVHGTVLDHAYLDWLYRGYDEDSLMLGDDRQAVEWEFEGSAAVVAGLESIAQSSKYGQRR